MKNRFEQPDSEPAKNLDELRTFFLACEFKPNTRLFSVLAPFAYDIRPAFVYGTLGILSYEPMSFGIISLDDQTGPLLGYVFTITEEDSLLLLDKIKGFYGDGSFNTHVRKLVHAYTDVNKVENAWAYVISEAVIEAYESIESVEMGMWDEGDEGQLELLEKIESAYNGE